MARKLKDILFRRNHPNWHFEPSIQAATIDNNNNNIIPLLVHSRFPVYDANGHLRPRFRTNHTLITVPSTISLEDLRSRIESALRDAGNPNAEDYIRHHGERVGRLCVHWGGRRHENGNGFPATTVLCEENLEAALLFMREGRGYDFVEVRVDLA